MHAAREHGSWWNWRPTVTRSRRSTALNRGNIRQHRRGVEYHPANGQRWTTRCIDWLIVKWQLPMHAVTKSPQNFGLFESFSQICYRCLSATGSLALCSSPLCPLCTCSHLWFLGLFRPCAPDQLFYHYNNQLNVETSAVLKLVKHFMKQHFWTADSFGIKFSNCMRWLHGKRPTIFSRSHTELQC